MIRPALAALVLSTSFAAPAFAFDDDDMALARLQRLDDRAQARNLSIKHAKAIEIAKQNGVATVREIDLDEDDEWEVEGRDANGKKIEVELSARDGKVRKIDRD